ncbi:YARHG domain-containing protein [Clostridium folliculivorans]|uniref:YARHG domain-containing protein n=1 Tax=Clostridium folliculivorans TaxID=2886038 RepID=A0A9W5XYH3_9CLOT|nr:YARHG domain-containing protein [Clostridium folliculivorans]GKU23231.1 hypothetical protein CFOLD11_00570 [Clostridium folliculivorans]GKU29348.1 hypothetical protein CFB3_14540 [Clostridium folliculivorans]
MKYCTKCGATILPNMKFCTKCGTPIQSEAVEEKRPVSEIESQPTVVDDPKLVEEKVVEERVYDEQKIVEEKDSGEQEIIDDKVYGEQGVIEEEVDRSKRLEKDDSLTYKIEKQQYKKSNKVKIATKKEEKRVKQNKTKIRLRIIPKIIIGVVIIVAILTGIFFKRIKGEYYIYRYNQASVPSEKLGYATKALQMLKTDNTKEILKKSLLETSQTDIDLAIAKLEELSSVFTQKEYQALASEMGNVKIDKLFSEGKYEEAFKQFEVIYKLGGDFKANSNYEDIMLNNVAKLIGSPVQSTKEMLLKNNKTYFGNLDEDVFDEIIQVTTTGYNEDTRLKVNLYKYVNGQYRLADNYLGEYDVDTQIQGIYNYDKAKKGIYIRTIGRMDVSTIVLGVTGGRLQLKGLVRANNYTGPVDIDKDGIYEVVANNVSRVTTSDKGTSKWFKVYDDGRTPTEVKVTAEQAANSSTIDEGNNTSNSSVNTSSNIEDYVFVDSDKRYLTDADLADLSKDRLAIARNEIFARHGYVFKTDEFKNYFTSKRWYVPSSSYDGTDTVFNEYEKANYKLIQQWENKK